MAPSICSVEVFMAPFFSSSAFSLTLPWSTSLLSTPRLDRPLIDLEGEDTMTLTVDTANDNVVKTQYAVRGEIVQIAAQLASEGKKIIYCNIGNPQSLGQKPITFFRQVLALCDCPTLLESPDVEKLFPTDAIARARAVLSACPGGTGAYSQSKGIQICREAIARGIERRDGFPSTQLDLHHRRRVPLASTCA